MTPRRSRSEPTLVTEARMADILAKPRLYELAAARCPTCGQFRRHPKHRAHMRKRAA